jgi:hypothetical protein
MAITPEQIRQLVEIVGEDEARPLVWRIITPDNEADLAMALNELNFWLEDDNMEYDTEDEEDDIEDENLPVPDANGNTQQLFLINGIEYLVWNGTTILDATGAQVGVRNDVGIYEFF